MAWPMEAKFYVEPPWEGGEKVYINGPGHMTKMAATPIYGQKLLCDGFVMQSYCPFQTFFFKFYKCKPVEACEQNILRSS